MLFMQCKMMFWRLDVTSGCDDTHKSRHRLSHAKRTPNRNEQSSYKSNRCGLLCMYAYYMMLFSAVVPLSFVHPGLLIPSL